VRIFVAVLGVALFAATQPGPDFREIGKESGLTASFPNGGDKSKEYIIETTGSGVAFIDYDNDGYLDIFVLSGDGGTNRMYHNDHSGHFTDVTAELGLTSSGWAEGVCAGDYDNDGYTDLFVTYWGQNRLYRNVGGKRFGRPALMFPLFCIVKVNEPVAEQGADAGLVYGLCGRFHLEVHVVKRSRPGPDHLKAGKFCAPVDIVGGEMRFERPDLLAKPVLQDHVICVAPQERHRRMRVRVRETR